MLNFIKEEVLYNKNLFIDSSGVKDKRYHSFGTIPDPKQIKTCEAWIKLYCSDQKIINHNHSSYRLKHVVENWGRNLNSLFDTEIASSYVTNGAFIQAAYNCGFYPVIFRNWGFHKCENLWNPYFRMKIANYSKKSLKFEYGRL